MKKAKRIISVLMITFVMILSISVNTVYAANGKIENGSFDGNLFEATSSKGPDTDHTSCTYSIDSQPAWCIDAGVKVKQGDGYNANRTIDDSGALSWLMLHSSQKGGTIDNQIVQAAVWKLTGNTVTSVGGDMNQVNAVIADAQACNNGISAADAEIHVSSKKLRYDRATNSYVSEKITVSNGTLDALNGQPFGAELVDFEDGKRIVVQAQNVTNDTSITVTASCNSRATRYGPATVWEKAESQTLITPNTVDISGQGTSATFQLEAVGDIKIRKLDEHGKPVVGTRFRVTGPHGFNKEVEVDADGYAYLYAEPERDHVRIGRYTIVETYVPANLVLDGQSHTEDVGSGSTLLWDFQQDNEYERGELSVKKEDVFKSLGKRNYGDGNFDGIVVELYAAEDIYEGVKDQNGNWVEASKTKVLSKDEKVAERTFNAEGTTRPVKEFTRQDGVHFDGLPLGKYYWKEKSTNQAYLMPSDATVVEAQREKYEQDITYVDMNTAYVPNKSITILNQEVYTKVIVYKMDNDNSNEPGGNDTDKNPAQGAVLRLTLKSNYNETTRQPIDASRDTYTATVNEFGKAEFINPEFERLYADTGINMECTIPFGTYVLDEIKTSDNGQSYYYGIQNLDIIAKEDNHTYRPIVMDEGIPVALKIVKIDLDDDDLNSTTHETVPIDGAKFKIWDLQTEDWVVQRMPNSEVTISEFTTNAEGYCILPQKLYAGEFVVYESSAPKGYYVNEELRIPKKSNGEEDRSKLGKTEFGGRYIDIRNVSVNVSDAEEYPEGEGILDLEYIMDNLMFTIELGNPTTRGNIDVYKLGEVFTSFTSNTSKKYEDDGYTDTITEHTPSYSMQALANCKFEVWPLEDVTTADGRIKEKAGTKHYIVTDSTGHGICKNPDGTEDKLFCNPDTGTKYRIHEVESPAGYDLAEDQDVVVFPGTEYKQVEMKGLEVHDTYIPFKLKLVKNFVRENEDGTMFKPANEYEQDPAIAIFGIYSKQDLYATNGQEIPKDTLIQTLRVVEGEDYTESYKLPDGEYYIEEMYTVDPFTIVDETTKEPHVYDFTVEHKKGVTSEQQIVVNADNTYPTGDIYVVKISSTTAIQAGGLTLKSNEEGYQEVAEFTELYSNRMTEQLMTGEVDVDKAIADVTKAFNLDRTDLVVLTPAQYGVYVDPECKVALQESTDGGKTYTDVVLKPMQVTENGKTYYNGVYSVKGIQEGTYYVKELVAPTYIDQKGKVRKYDLSKDVTIIDVMDSMEYDEQTVIMRVLVDDSPVFETEKTDIFTDKGIPDCLFTITDKNGKELLRYVTIKEGIAKIPTDIFQDGETYYFTELEAPKYPYYDGDVLYELNTEPHRFTAHVDDDGKWKMEFEDENGVKQEYERIKIQNYRTITDVELTKLDMVDSTPIPNCKFVLKGVDTNFEEVGVTDENGIYIFKNVPYGKYKYTELEAPDGWMIDTTPHEFTLDSHGTKIVVYDERAIDVNTGDIAVIAIACIALVSVAGIVLVVIKNKKANSSK